MAELSFSCPTPGNTTSTSGISLADHEIIDSLVHNLSEDSFQSIVRNPSGQVTDYNVFTSSSGVAVRSTAITRNAEGEVIEVVENQHDVGGAIVQTLTTTVTRSGGQVVSIETDETEFF